MNQNPVSKLSMRDKSELEKYIRSLVLKMSQVIVQSRFGEKKKSQKRINSTVHDWFNLAIEDHAEIQAKVKEAYNNVLHARDFCVCTEILLKTADGDTLVLETWSLRLSNLDSSVPSSSNTSLASVYCRMTLLLKSVIAVTRVTPAYKLSTCQSADTYVILFRIYVGEPQVHQLGQHYQESKIGEVLTPVGIIKMSVAYRSKDDMTITPQKVEKESPFMVKSDYFKPDMSPQTMRSDGADKNPLEELKSLGKGCCFIHSNNPVSNGHGGKQLYPLPECERGHLLVNGDSKNACLNCPTSPNDFRKIGAFAPSMNVPDTTLLSDLAILEKPFLNLSRSKLKSCEKRPVANGSSKCADKNANLNLIDNKKDGNEVDYNCNTNGQESSQQSSDGSDYEDFVMVEMKPPFAGCDGDNGISAFYKECQCAPPLASFASQPSLKDQVIDITSQLAKFETSMNDFDNFVDSICQVDGEK